MEDKEHFIIAAYPSHLILYFVPLPFPSIATTPFSPIAFSNCVVFDLPNLFDETIEDNLRIAKPDATQEEIEAACKLASIHDFILTLPDGYKTRVGALGDNLSAGEKQRIGLARAFLRGSELILLDEPTSNVDSINEGIILKALKEQKNKKSIILVSHRESTMAIADIIYRVKDGRMLEC